jgi:hypothetical protein
MTTSATVASQLQIKPSVCSRDFAACLKGEEAVAAALAFGIIERKKLLPSKGQIVDGVGIMAINIMYLN